MSGGKIPPDEVTRELKRCGSFPRKGPQGKANSADPKVAAMARGRSDCEREGSNGRPLGRGGSAAAS